MSSWSLSSSLPTVVGYISGSAFNFRDPGSPAWPLAGFFDAGFPRVVQSGDFTLSEFLATDWQVTLPDGYSMPMTTLTFPPPLTPSVPDAPSFSVAISNTSLTLSWIAPYDGGSALTGYSLTYTPMGGSPTTVTLSAGATSRTITGLTTGVSVALSLTAINSVGNSAAATASATPATVPSAPSVTWTAGTGSASLSWSAPSSGGSPITGYQVTLNGSVIQILPAASHSTTITGLVQGVRYPVTVSAISTAGIGAAWSGSVACLISFAIHCCNGGGFFGNTNTAPTGLLAGGIVVSSGLYGYYFEGDYIRLGELVTALGCTSADITVTGTTTSAALYSGTGGSQVIFVPLQITAQTVALTKSLSDLPDGHLRIDCLDSEIVPDGHGGHYNVLGLVEFLNFAVTVNITPR